MMDEELTSVKVRGCCPSCGSFTLIVYIEEREIVCNSKHCTDPYTLHKIIQNEETHHIVYFHLDDTFTMLHPLKERVNEALANCDPGIHLSSLSGPPVDQPGKYRMRKSPLEGDPYEYLRLED